MLAKRDRCFQKTASGPPKFTDKAESEEDCPTIGAWDKTTHRNSHQPPRRGQRRPFESGQRERLRKRGGPDRPMDMAKAITGKTSQASTSDDLTLQSHGTFGKGMQQCRSVANVDKNETLGALSTHRHGQVRGPNGYRPISACGRNGLGETRSARQRPNPSPQKVGALVTCGPCRQPLDVYSHHLRAQLQ